MKYAAVVSIALLVALPAVEVAAQDDGIKVVVHQSSSVSSITEKELAYIFLKVKSKWPDGTKAYPIDQKDINVWKPFCEKVISRSPSQVDSYWQGQVFSARSTPPPKVATDREVLDFVKTKPGAVGYVSAAADTSEVKVIAILAQ
jgi:ABC-type phosphate transport system substrate-binding protein